MHVLPTCAATSTYLCELFLFPAPGDEGSLMDVRIGGLPPKARLSGGITALRRAGGGGGTVGIRRR